MIRAFIALPIPGSFHPLLAQVQNELRRSQADVKWTTPEQQHLTIQFMGNTDESKVPAILECLNMIVQQTQRFELKLGSVGAFPSPSRPRVLWVGLEGDLDALRKLQNDVQGEMQALGFPLEDREFHPHITLGRVRSPRGLRELSSFLDSMKPLVTEPFLPNALILFQSQLSPKGAIYTPLGVIQWK